MKVAQAHWTRGTGWAGLDALIDAQLILAFGSLDEVDTIARLAECRACHPRARIVGCSTAGEIVGARVHDGTMVATMIAFDHTAIRVETARIAGPGSSFEVGQDLATRLHGPGLAHVLIFSDGICVNGTALASGMLGSLPPGATVSGGLAGDGERMQRTLVYVDGAGEPGMVAAVGLYGDRLRVGFGSKGGWDPFGPERLITRSQDNVLYELDNQSALALYKTYLGDHANDLPSSGLLFPLSVRSAEGGEPVVRTILGVSEADQSMTFAGDLVVGHYARLMKANFDRLVDGAYGAAEITRHRSGGEAELAILVSCVGRRMILRQRVEEELESVCEVLGAIPTTGFYSYGELSPGGALGCELHNQTMTITTLAEL